MIKQYFPRLVVIILLQSALNTLLFAQAPLPKQWDKRFGGSNTDIPSGIQQTTDGGYIIGGSSASGISGDKTEDSRGRTDDWVVKIDANGVKQWDKRFGGNKEESISSVQQTPDGGYILGGYSASGINGDKTEPNRGDYDYWIVKIDANGIKQWDKTFGGTLEEYLNSIQQTSDGGYIAGGYSASGISGDKTEASRGNRDYWIVKIDSNGTKQWDKTFGGDADDLLFSVQQDKSGGYIAGGYSASGISGDKTQSSWGDNDYWIIKIDANGSKQWDKRFGGSANDLLYTLQQTADGGYILGGDSYSGTSGDKTQASRGGWDYWTVKLDENGTKQWDKRFGGSNYDYFLFSVKQTIDGGYILGGESYSGVGGDKSQPARGGVDYWMVKTDASGIKEWDARFGADADEPFAGLQQTADGGYVLAGFSYSGINGDKTESKRGNEDFWIIKLGCPPSAKVQSLNDNDICVSGVDTLIADASPGVKFQWLKDKVIIEGATDNIYTATEPGNYRVIVYTSKECSQLSKVINVSNSCKEITNSISIFPNPSNGVVNVTYNSKTGGKTKLMVYDKAGKLIYTKVESAIKGKNISHLNLSNLINGAYNLQLINGNEESRLLFIIKK